MERGAITFIEWAEPALDLLDDPTTIRLCHQTPVTRSLTIEGPVAERFESLIGEHVSTGERGC